MARTGLMLRLFTGVTLWAGFGLTAQAQLPAVTAEGACQVMPIQPGVAISTPPPNLVAQCRVEPIPSNDPKVPMGYLVRDPAGKPVRQFVSYDGKNYNIRAFYLDGIEAYREVFPLKPTDPVQFRWFGANGSKWGLDRARSGRIDEWVAISPEEVSQELLLAVLTNDSKRAEALVLTKTNLDSIGFTNAEAQKLLARAANIGKKISDAAAALKAAPDAKWVQLQLAPPQTTPADALGTREDLVTYKNGTVLLQDGKTTKFLQIGDLVQIGRTWKLVDGPGSGSPEFGNPGTGPIPPEIEALVAQLNQLDQVDPATLSTRPALAAYNAKRVKVLEQIIAKLPPEKQETWLRLNVDALSAAAEVEKPDGEHIARLKQIKESLAKGQNQALAAYACYRFLIAENNIAINGGDANSFVEIQQKWRTALDEFVKAYPNSDEAPEAILRLAMAFEYQKDGEPKAKDWYTLLAKNYAKHPHAAKAVGALKRLESEGKPFDLVGPNLANGQAFNVAGFAGNVVIVYYCAGWGSTVPEDAKKLQALVSQYGAKGLQVVTVCLDNDAKTAVGTVQNNKIPGSHLFMPGGLDASPLASSYGVLVVPHVFILGKDGKVVNRNAQMANLEDEVKKLLP